ncbi:MAG: hypothetical protein BAJALOKI2v1_340021 [Promethearchaeota archaeon]|nr:MAG: hypothetical protein BAJALOKI2v1_340021 [Candidatus Lokiarchaeota archaeon]
MSSKNMVKKASIFKIETIYKSNLEEPLIQLEIRTASSLANIILTLREANELHLLLGQELEVHE